MKWRQTPFQMNLVQPMSRESFMYAFKANLGNSTLITRKCSRLAICLLVHATSLQSLLTVIAFINFKYVGFLENCPDCTTLRARTTTEPAQDTIIVKFVDQYGEKAHRLLADEGLAVSTETFLLWIAVPQ